MKSKLTGLIKKIIDAVEELQAHSFVEFQHLLPDFINHEGDLRYTLLDSFFFKETGISIRDYFNGKKAEKASMLFDYYRLEPLEVAFQLGFKSASSLKKAISITDRQRKSRIRYSVNQRKMSKIPEYML